MSTDQALPARIQACIQKGQHAEAQTLARQFVAQDQSNAIAWILLAQALLGAGDRLGAAASYERAFVLAPSKHYAIPQWFYLSHSAQRAPAMLATLRAVLSRPDLTAPSTAVLARFATALAEQVGRTAA